VSQIKLEKLKKKLEKSGLIVKVKDDEIVVVIKKKKPVKK
jgi:hypothetical protein